MFGHYHCNIIHALSFFIDVDKYGRLKWERPCPCEDIMYPIKFLKQVVIQIFKTKIPDLNMQKQYLSFNRTPVFSTNFTNNFSRQKPTHLSLLHLRISTQHYHGPHKECTTLTRQPGRFNLEITEITGGHKNDHPFNLLQDNSTF